MINCPVKRSRTRTSASVLDAATKFQQLQTSKISAPRDQNLLNAATQKFAKMVGVHTLLGGPVALTTPLSTGPAAVGPHWPGHEKVEDEDEDEDN